MTARRPAARGSSAPAPGAKTARGLATQAALVRAAQKVFERDGFLDARIADITATARTATGSFYTYFNGKEEIFLAVLEALDEVGPHPPSLEYLAEGAVDVDLAFVFEEEGAESIDGLAETLTRLWVNALRVPLA